MDSNSDFSRSNSVEVFATRKEPLEFDVVCGRGKGSYNRRENKQFRAITAHYVPEYLECQNRVEKAAILNKIITAVHSQNNGMARFVKFNSDDNCWQVINEDLTREKVGHAIREAILSIGRQEKRDETKAVFKVKHIALLAC